MFNNEKEFDLSTINSKKELFQYATKFEIVVPDDSLEKMKIYLVNKLREEYEVKSVTIYLERHCIFKQKAIYKGSDGMYYLEDCSPAKEYMEQR